MKRRGFTLIELMVVIAIIIILAAIAIPNYLNMTARAKRSRVASDFAALATALETYRTDWNEYPAASSDQSITESGSAYGELAGTTGGTVNISNETTATGETGPIIYITENVLKSMVNPYTGQTQYQYTSTGTTWTLTAATGETGAKALLKRTDVAPTLVDSASG